MQRKMKRTWTRVFEDVQEMPSRLGKKLIQAFCIELNKTFCKKLKKEETMKLQERRRFQSLSLFITLVITLTMYPIKAPAQIYGSLEVDIPFQFYVVNTKLPSGRYIFRMLDNSDMGPWKSLARLASVVALPKHLDAALPEATNPFPGTVDLLRKL